MKKRYIMLIGRISGMGGGQMYVNNKLNFVSSLGWESAVYFAIPGEIIIPELKKYEDNLVEQMIVSPLVHTKKSRKKVLDLMVEKIGDFDQAVIESSNPYMALWGELLAKRLNCKHMVHLLDEKLDKGVPIEYLDFYHFKHRRRELSGINSHSLKILFRNDPRITDENSYNLSSVCSNVVDETDKDSLNIPKKDITLGCLGRLDKEFIGVTINSFYEVASKYSEKQFNIFFIGDSDKKADKVRITDRFSNLSNVNLILPGALFPVPSATIKKADLCVSSSGSARVCYSIGVPTISIDATDLKPIGVLGYTTLNAAFRKNEPIIDLTCLIEQILFTNYLEQFPYTPAVRITLEPLKKHIDFLENSDTSKAYYNIDMMKAAGTDKKKRFIHLLLGSNLYAKFRHFTSMKLKGRKR